jgi:hypothetical protein
MAERRIFIVLGTAGEDGGVVLHGRLWEVEIAEEDLEKFAGSLTEMCGEPAEWVSGDGEAPGRLSMLFREGGTA